ncbi:MAG: flavodoxin family protein [Candidatus Diapherotrites archaeon]|uniref:Flavodoxin family protein n=1 Tax=Candidatus Iainarchaeum sp. TaxID=3101447 RepID=A0A938YRE9_9ARCH|nr:flavodoxin family protein [Candidatus Diapherotrites archaeon]
MNVLVAYYSKTGATEKVALALEKAFGEGNTVTVFRIRPEHELKAHEYRKSEKDLPLQKPLPSLKDFDLVIVGTPVWGFCPTPIVVSYLRQLQGAKGKRFALFATCTALPGTTIMRLSNILSTKGATVVDTLTIRSIFELDAEKLKPVQGFAQRLLKEP